MVVRTKVESIDRDVEAIIRRDLSPEARSAALAQFAQEALEDGEEHNFRAIGRIPPHSTFVDGRPEVPLETVRPEGEIVFEFNLLEDLFSWIGEQLVLHAPVGSTGDKHPGLYRESFAFFADATEVPYNMPAPQASEYSFVNRQPYARKIERGLSPQAPDGVFQAVAEMAKRRFGNLAMIRFAYRDFVGGQRTPAIVIKLRG